MYGTPKDMRLKEVTKADSFYAFKTNNTSVKN